MGFFSRIRKAWRPSPESTGPGTWGNQVYEEHTAPRTRLETYPQVVCFGDSITQYGYSHEHQGWVGALSDWFVREVEFRNRGYSGYTTETCLPVFKGAFDWDANPPPMLVVIFLGVNDSVDVQKHSNGHVPIPRYKSNLKFYINTLEKKGLTSRDIVLVCPTPCDDQEMKKSGRSVALTKPYADACREVAKECNTQCVDLWSLFFEEGDISTLFCDGLHFNYRGNYILAKALKGIVKKSLCEYKKKYDWKTQDNGALAPRQIHAFDASFDKYFTPNRCENEKENKKGWLVCIPRPVTSPSNDSNPSTANSIERTKDTSSGK
eukprot:Nk52_evm28s255 gene=Nk52_evmTU28s255